ncbi:MAG: EAL domain-containing protein [Clostridia bacterium]|nr:EAL domain-containing protein [Clostridia bacterium]
MRRLIYSMIVFILIGGIVLTAYAPDEVSTVLIVLMETIVFIGVVFGILPLIQYYHGFERGLDNIERAMEVQTSSTWSVMGQIEDFFNQRTMDSLFQSYREKVQSQRESGQMLADIEDYINDDILGIHSWRNVVMQIPGTLTGLGILGTFIGLIIGIQGIGFSSVNAALSSVQTLLSGIQVAFYSSIAGVILSLLFNIIYRIAWNVMSRNLGLFIEEFHKNVIPPVEEQLRYRERKEIKQITDLLERLPRGGAFSVSNGGGSPAQGQSSSNEQILMPQILQGLKDGEFVFYLQPRFDLNNRKVVGAEALVRWNHGKLGTVSPAVFIPVLESNGYITKLDQYIWEQVCATIRRWIDSGLRPVPVTINVTKTDIMAMDTAQFFIDMLKKYRLPPRQLDIDIAENAYMQSSAAVLETEMKLRQNGFRVAVDGFDGNFVALMSVDGLQADMLKLDLRRFAGNQNQAALNGLFEQARKLQFNVTVEGIESMEQMSMLRKCGCSEGQGFYLSKPMSVQEFETMTSEEGNK